MSVYSLYFYCTRDTSVNQKFLYMLVQMTEAVQAVEGTHCDW